LPVDPVTATFATIVPGTRIPARTLGSVERAAERIVISVPVPVPLSTEAPAVALTIPPYATTAPTLPPRPRQSTPTALPTTYNPDDDASAVPAATR
jgi:hypothetical protein